MTAPSARQGLDAHPSAVLSSRIAITTAVTPAAKPSGRGEETECGPGRHPLAWSTTRAVNGSPFFGVTLNERPQWPTITSAGAGCE